ATAIRSTFSEAWAGGMTSLLMSAVERMPQRTGSALIPMTPPSSASLAAERGVDELVRSDRILLGLRRAQAGIVDPRSHRVDEAPLEDAAPDRANGVLGVRVEIEAESLAVVAVAGAA